MPLPIAHGLLGASIVAAIHPAPTRRFYLPLLIGAVAANAADFDFALSLLTGSKGWHRGLTHSLFFALLVILITLVSRGESLFRGSLAYGLAYTSHFLLDFATTKQGDGVEFLFPLTDERFGLRLCGLSELPSKLSPIEILGSLGLEFLIFAPVFLTILWIRFASADNHLKPS